MNVITARAQNQTALSNVTEKELLVMPATLLTLINLLGIVGNAIVIHAILTQKRFQTNYYYLVCHLAISDFVVLLTFVEQTLHFWIPSLQLTSTSVVCELLYFTQTLFYTSGALFLLYIGLLRYRGTIHPFKVRFTRRKLKYLVFAGYLGSFLLSLPYALLFRVKSNRCVLLHEYRVYNVIATTMMFFFNFVIPVVLIHGLYLKIICQLLIEQRSRVASLSGCEARVRRHRRFSRAVILSFFIVCLFAISSAPFEILWLATVWRSSKIAAATIPSSVLFIKLFGTCAVNPLIYGVADSSLRQSFRQTFRKITNYLKK